MKTKDNSAAIEELKLALGLLVRRMRATAPNEQHELSWTQKSVMLRLEKERAITAAELARAEGVKPQSMSTAIAQLESRGLIERKPRPDDGRQFDVKLTPKAVALRRQAKDASRTWFAEAIVKLDKNEQATLFKAGDVIRKLAEL